MKLAAGAPRAILSVLVAVLGLGLLYANPAAATPRPEVVKEAERRFRRATELYHEGRYQEALFIYQGAYDLLPSVSILFNIGLTKEKLLDFAGCAEAFQRYLSEAASEKEAEAARAHLETCRGRAVLVVPVSSMPPGAAIYVGPPGEKPAFRGRTPARIELRPGKHVLAVEMQGYVRQSQALDR